MCIASEKKNWKKKPLRCKTQKLNIASLQNLSKHWDSKTELACICFPAAPILLADF